MILKTLHEENNNNNYYYTIKRTGDKFPIIRKAVNVESNKNPMRLLKPGMCESKL